MGRIKNLTKKNSTKKIQKQWNLPEDKLEEIQKNIAIIISILAPKFKFGPYEYEDLEMLALIGMNEKYEKFDENRGSKLYNFMYTCISNLLYNLTRDKFKRFSPPCAKCPLDAFIDKKCTAYEDLMECSYYEDWVRVNGQKQNLMHVYSVDDGTCKEDRDLIDIMGDKEQIKAISCRLTEKNKSVLNLFLQKEKITTKKMDEMIDECRFVLGMESSWEPPVE